MRYSGIQPQYFPRLHYFARILQADIFVMRDDAQYVAKHKYPDGSIGKSYQSHTPIKTDRGLFLLTVPVVHQGYQSIAETAINPASTWAADHLKTIEYAYKKAPYFQTIFPELTLLLSTQYETVGDLNTATILWGIFQLLGEKISSPDQLTIEAIIRTLRKKKVTRLQTIQKASILSNERGFNDLHKNEKIIALIQAVGANEDYCGGTAMDAYMNNELFEKNNISVVVQDWKSSKYAQLFENRFPFIPNLSIIDLLMNCSRQEALAILLR